MQNRKKLGIIPLHENIRLFYCDTNQIVIDIREIEKVNEETDTKKAVLFFILPLVTGQAKKKLVYDESVDWAIFLCRQHGRVVKSAVIVIGIVSHHSFVSLGKTFNSFFPAWQSQQTVLNHSYIFIKPKS